MANLPPTSLELPDGGFTYVTRGKKKRKVNAGRPGSQPDLTFRDQLELTRQEFQSSDNCARFRGMYIEMSQSRAVRCRDNNVDSSFAEFIERLTRELSIGSPPKRALCLGLGSPSVSVDSRWQLVLLLELVSRFKIDPSEVEVYDPLFTESDVLELKRLNLRTLSENASGHHTIEEGTLLYLPHCPMVLLERILRTNWSEPKLKSLILVGNDVKEWLEGRRSHQAKYPCIERITPFLSSTPFLPDLGVSETAFSGMAFQTINLEITPTSTDIAYPPPIPSVPSPRKKRRPTKPTFSPKTVLLPTDDEFWSLPEEDAALSQDLEII
ncbi:hypothetical protein FRB90_005513 [Tulasnella sp. 427]|nr:hypothetical protein FRB90_005513 [Tulasnella sp. 427]